MLQMGKKRLIIGIDPDVDKNGVAQLHKTGIKSDLKLSNLTFFELFDFLKTTDPEITNVVIEGGWLVSKSNFHNERSGVRVAARIGKNTGSNHEAGRKIVEMCEYLQIPHRVVRPLKKGWGGRDGKITHGKFVRLTGVKTRTNQEMRDAALLVWGS